MKAISAHNMSGCGSRNNCSVARLVAVLNSWSGARGRLAIRGGRLTVKLEKMDEI